MNARRHRRFPVGNAIERLRDGHVQIDELFKAFDRRHREARWRSYEAKRLVDLICTMLRVHDDLEDSVLQPALMRAVGAHPVLEQARQRRAAIAEALERLEALPSRDPELAASVADLARQVRLRFESDEIELFGLVERARLDLPALDVALGRRQGRMLSAGRLAA